jgi:rSAM/selenodomain-associated transferase 1
VVSEKRLLIILAKVPEPGISKTRLGESIGYQQAADIYRAFLEDLVPRFYDKCLEADICWLYTPQDTAFEKNYGPRGENGRVFFTHRPVGGLMEQQVAQLKWAVAKGYQSIIIVTTDSPQLTSATIRKGFDLLKHGDVVLGPASDGGYYLLGIRKDWQILDQIQMSTAHVASDVSSRAKVRGLHLAKLETLPDIDDWSTLQVFIDTMKDRGRYVCPHTWKQLTRMGLVKNADR